MELYVMRIERIKNSVIKIRIQAFKIQKKHKTKPF